MEVTHINTHLSSEALGNHGIHELRRIHSSAAQR